jgi:hypothetical protein
MTVGRLEADQKRKPTGANECSVYLRVEGTLRPCSESTGKDDQGEGSPIRGRSSGTHVAP